MKEFFDYLKSKRLIPNKDLLIHAMVMSDESCRDLVINGIGYASITQNVNRSSNFDFLANSTLSGGDFPCSKMPCRLKNIERLARNAALYADTVYLTNPFEKYYHHEKFTEYDKYEIAQNVYLLYAAKPLFDEGIFKLSSSIMHVCENCLKKLNIAQKRYEKKLVKTQWDLLDMVWKRNKFEVKLAADGAPYVEVTGDTDIYEHSIVYNLMNCPDAEIIAKVKKLVTPGKISLEQLIDLGIAGNIINPIVDDLVNQHFYANHRSAHYLTNRTIDGKCIDKNHKKSAAGQNKLIAGALKHELPFLDGLELKKLLELRKKEGEAFQLYRSSFTSFLADAKKDYDLKQAFDDEIRPEINRMNQTIKKAKKLIAADIKKDLIVGSTFVSVGLFSHLLPPNIAQIVAAVGGINYLGKFGENVKKAATVESEISDNKYYFIWKLGKSK